MSRHRDIRNLDYDEEYEHAYDDTVYGHSVDDYEFGTSPSTDQYLYSRSREQEYAFGAYFPRNEDITEVEEATVFEDHSERKHSISGLKLSTSQEVQLASVLVELKRVLGRNFSDDELTNTVIEENFDFESSLNALLKRRESKPGQDFPLPQQSKQNAIKDNFPLLQNVDLDQKKNVAPVVVVASDPSADNSRVVVGFEVSEGAVSSSVASEGEETRSRSSTPVADRESSIPIVKAPVRLRDREVDVCSKYKCERSDGKELLNLVVVGHVDAGKSTLMGHLLYLRGNVSKRVMHKYEEQSRKLGKLSFMYAWVLDDTDEERSRGITVDVAQRLFETEHRTINLLDAPGHRDFIPNMIMGAARADVAILVVDASKGGFEAGFDSGGQTREHAILIRSLGLSQLIVAVNKLDTVDWSEARFMQLKSALRQFLKTVGFKDSDVTYIPCSGLNGENLTAKSNISLFSWYSGPTLLEVLDILKVPARNISKPIRFCISDVYKAQGSTICVAGRLETGYVQNGDKLLLLPKGDTITVKNIQSEGSTLSCGYAGDHVVISIVGVESGILHTGDFLCDPANPIPQVSRIQARIVIFNISVPIIKGTQVDFHYQSVTEPAKVRKLISLLQKTTGEVIKERPRALTKNAHAIVEIEFSRQMCIELYRDFKEFGRFMLRISGATVAAGLVTQLLS